MKYDKKKIVITPGAALASLPRIEFDPEQEKESKELGQAELLQSLLLITQMDHTRESDLVQNAVKNALGDLPEIGA